MPKLTGTLASPYGQSILEKDDFVCRYCVLDGEIWPNWLYLSQDHLLPRGHPERDNPNYIVAACLSCNTLRNRARYDVEGKTVNELVEQKRRVVLQRRSEYENFWKETVRPKGD